MNTEVEKIVEARLAEREAALAAQTADAETRSGALANAATDANARAAAAEAEAAHAAHLASMRVAAAERAALAMALERVRQFSSQWRAHDRALARGQRARDLSLVCIHLGVQADELLERYYLPESFDK